MNRHRKIFFAWFLYSSFAVFGQGEARIETTYDQSKDRTTVRLAPVQILISNPRYHSLHMSPSFSYAGKTYVKPTDIDFELQTVVKGRLRTDLYVVFVVDGQEIFLSSNRWAVKNPVRGRTWVGERLVFRMPFETLQRLVEAKRAGVKFDGVLFPFDDSHKRILKKFAEEVSGVAVAQPR